MALLKQNILANLAGGIWIGLLTLIITPLQVNLLGMEAYGVLGFIAALQIMATVLDLGLSTTLTRELAGDTSSGHVASRPLLRTALTFYWGMAILIGLLLSVPAGQIATAWFNPNTLDAATLEKTLRVVAVFLALRWPVSLYSGVLAGAQRMVTLNLVKSSMTSLRLLGGILVLLAWRDLGIFVTWIACSALIEVLTYAVVCRRILPGMDWRPGFSLPALSAVWRFSLSMNALAILGMGITQLDRLLIGKMLPLADMGYYSLAYSAATSISLILTALSSALMPSLAAAYGANARSTLLSRYNSASRVMLFATGLVLFPLFFFGEDLLAIWVNPDAAAGAWYPLMLLACGFWLGAIYSNAYSMAIACRATSLILKVSLLSALPYALGLYWSIGLWGIAGAAGAWVALNLVYVLTIIPMVHHIVLKTPATPWFSTILLPFLLLGVATFGGARLTSHLLFHNTFALGMLIPAVIAYAGIGYFLLGATVRNDITQTLRRYAKA
ncbi:MAG: oligosaccharide flippase family protein [Rugosibacter sp.]|nr:oligosaccharide flippase family protein [Rugosibacter sp.]